MLQTQTSLCCRQFISVPYVVYMSPAVRSLLTAILTRDTSSWWHVTTSDVTWPGTCWLLVLLDEHRRHSGNDDGDDGRDEMVEEADEHWRPAVDCDCSMYNNGSCLWWPSSTTRNHIIYTSIHSCLINFHLSLCDQIGDQTFTEMQPSTYGWNDTVRQA